MGKLNGNAEGLVIDDRDVAAAPSLLYNTNERPKEMLDDHDVVAALSRSFKYFLPRGLVIDDRDVAAAPSLLYHTAMIRRR